MKKSINVIFIVLTIIFFIAAVILGVKLFTMKSEGVIKLNGNNTDRKAQKITLGDKVYVAVEDLNGIFGADFNFVNGDMNIVTEDLSKMSEEMAFAISYAHLYDSQEGKIFGDLIVYTVEETENAFKVIKTIDEEAVNDYRAKLREELSDKGISAEETDRYVNSYKSYSYALVSKSEGKVVETDEGML